MKKLIAKLFEPRYYDWQDIAVLSGQGNWYLLQMRSHRSTNKKQFKKRPLGWINDCTMKVIISESIIDN